MVWVLGLNPWPHGSALACGEGSLLETEWVVHPFPGRLSPGRTTSL